MGRRTPPLRHCRDCGCAIRSWRENPTCGRRCPGRPVDEQPVESLRDFRRRLPSFADLLDRERG